MKALMSVGALVGVIGLLLLVGMIFDVVPSNTVRLVEGYMPMQMLSELAIFIAGFTGLSYMLSSMGMAIPRFWQGIGFWAFILLYLKFRVYPPIPFSVRAMYGTCLLYTSDAADERSSVDLGGRRIIKKKKKKINIVK